MGLRKRRERQFNWRENWLDGKLFRFVQIFNDEKVGRTLKGVTVNYVTPEIKKTTPSIS